MVFRRELLSIDEARDCVLREARPLPPESRPLAQAAGRILADDARARVDLPPFDSSAMDGFALRAGDTPGRLRVVTRVAAGSPAMVALAAGEAAAIATGAAVPPGADAVVPIERATEFDAAVEIAEAAPLGLNVRVRGGDAEAGSVVVTKGTRLGPQQLGALAAAGCDPVVCGRRPHLVIACTGSELRRSGEPLEAGQIYESNGPLLSAAAAAAGASVEMLEIVPDELEAHRRALEQGLVADVLLTTGGVSVGRQDLVREVARELGVAERFWGVSVKPGKPLAFGVHGSTLVFGLPGNPVSTLVLFELFVRPALLRLQHASEPGPVFAAGRLSRRLERDRHRDRLVRARLRPGSGELEPLAGQESHMIVRAARASALVLVPRGSGWLAAGSEVRFLALS
jgi:molybdopterin molybdotransferase